MSETELQPPAHIRAPRRRSMLAPVAYSESAMPALRLARSSRIARRIARFLFAGLIMTILLMAFAPWQQFITGTGNVIAYAPLERQQVLEAPIEGRVVGLGDDIFENARVARGQVIAELRDLDELYSGRLDLQLANSRQTATAVEQQLAASRDSLRAALTIVESSEAQVHAYINVKTETAAAQDAFVEMAVKKVAAEQQQLAEYEAAIPQLQAEVNRTRALYEHGNISLQKLQEVERKLSEQKAKVNRAQKYVAAAKAELEGKRRERVAKIEKAQVNIDYATAALRKTEGDVAKAESDIFKAQQELNKAQKEVLEMEIKVARQATQKVLAPFDGIVVQITPNLGTSVLKKGDPICTIVPDTEDRAVQVWLKGNDAPLVEPGDHVRLQFEGWPAVQFAGWPSIAIGTFGGQVVSVDATDDGKGKFRILIRPDLADSADEPWPDDRFLRQGVHANAWVLLRRVPLWFEVWRQLNGFPPVVDMPGEPAKDDKEKLPKLPK